MTGSQNFYLINYRIMWLENRRTLCPDENWDSTHEACSADLKAAEAKLNKLEAYARAIKELEEKDPEGDKWMSILSMENDEGEFIGYTVASAWVDSNIEKNDSDNGPKDASTEPWTSGTSEWDTSGRSHEAGF